MTVHGRHLQETNPVARASSLFIHGVVAAIPGSHVHGRKVGQQGQVVRSDGAAEGEVAGLDGQGTSGAKLDAVLSGH